MNCPVCGRGPLLSWGDKGDHDYYCPAHHGPLGVGLFYREVWDGEKYVLTHSKPGPDVIERWRLKGVLLPDPPAPQEEKKHVRNPRTRRRR